MKQILVMMMAAVLVGCGEKDLPETQAKNPETPKTDVNETTAPKIQPKVEAKNPQPPKATSEMLIADPIVEKAVREELEKPEGKLTELHLNNTKITDAGLKEVAKLQKLRPLITPPQSPFKSLIA